MVGDSILLIFRTNLYNYLNEVIILVKIIPNLFCTNDMKSET